MQYFAWPAPDMTPPKYIRSALPCKIVIDFFFKSEFSLQSEEEMEASEVDWETINANLPFEHTEESHAQRR